MIFNMSDSITDLPGDYWWWLHQVAIARDFLLPLKKYQAYAKGKPVPTFKFNNFWLDNLHFWEQQIWNHSLTVYESVPRGSIDKGMRDMLLGAYDQIALSDESLGLMASELTQWELNPRIIGLKQTKYSPYSLPGKSWREYCHSTGDSINCVIQVTPELFCHQEHVRWRSDDGEPLLSNFGLLATNQKLLSIEGTTLRKLALKITQHAGALPCHIDDFRGDKEVLGFTMFKRSPISSVPNIKVIDSSLRWPALMLSPETTGWIGTFQPRVFVPSQEQSNRVCKCCGQREIDYVRLYASHPRRFLRLVAYGSNGSPPTGFGWIVGEANESSYLTS